MVDLLEIFGRLVERVLYWLLQTRKSDGSIGGVVRNVFLCLCKEIDSSLDMLDGLFKVAPFLKRVEFFAKVLHSCDDLILSMMVHALCRFGPTASRHPSYKSRPGSEYRNFEE